MALVEFVNHNSHTVILSTPDKRALEVKPRSRVILDEWYMHYSPKHITFIRYINEQKQAHHNKISTINDNIKKQKESTLKEELKAAIKSGLNRRDREDKLKAKEINKGIKENTKENTKNSHKSKFNVLSKNKNKLLSYKDNLKRPQRKSRVVGVTAKVDHTKDYVKLISNNKFRISNNIGIGILSYNRLDSLKRLINSIRKNTDLNKTTVFVSDESLSEEIANWLKEQTDIVSIINSQRLGIAGNTNRLMHALSRFKYKFILNDDVEILNSGWEQFYINASQRSDIQHFCYRQYGVYGADKKTDHNWHINNIKLKTVYEKPHGAVLFFTDHVFKKIGYFDENFGYYGMEHVDWSERVYKSGMQPKGFHDVVNSENYFKINSEKTSIENKNQCLKEARSYKDTLLDDRVYVNASDKTKIDSITYVIPFKNLNRSDAIASIINCIRGQMFPSINIICVEQDLVTNINLNLLLPCKYSLVQGNNKFNKSKAFNNGVILAEDEFLILHDADILISSNYTTKMFNHLTKYESVHIGNKILYYSQESSEVINKTGLIDNDKLCERMVVYFEGGSVGIRKRTFFEVGGFNEEYESYGCEDCDFFYRILNRTKMNNNRTEDMLHLWHSRYLGWNSDHERNKLIDAKNRDKDLDNYTKELKNYFNKKYKP